MSRSFALRPGCAAAGDARPATPTEQRLVPGSFDFRGDVGNALGIRESHALIGNAWGWHDGDFQGGANVAFGEGVECVYFGPNATDCHPWAVMFVDVLDPSLPNLVAFATRRDAGTGDWLFEYWGVVGAGSFVLTYAGS